MPNKQYYITAHDAEINKKWQDLIEMAKEKGILEICESRTKREIVEAILIDFCSIATLIVVNIAMFKWLGIWGIIGVSLFIYAYDISYNTKNIFHRLIKTWGKAQ